MAMPKPYPRERYALAVWVKWNQWIESLGMYPQYRVEDLESTLIDILRRVGHNDVPTQAEVSAALSRDYGHNTRKHRPDLTWEELSALDRELADAAWAMAARYGYEYGEAAPSLNSSTPEGHPHPSQRRARVVG